MIFRHWIPIVTFCPVNGLPDLVYISVTYTTKDVPELYALRKRIRKDLMWRKLFMEDIPARVFDLERDASVVTVRLAFSRHVVTHCRSA